MALPRVAPPNPRASVKRLWWGVKGWDCWRGTDGTYPTDRWKWLVKWERVGPLEMRVTGHRPEGPT